MRQSTILLAVITLLSCCISTSAIDEKDITITIVGKKPELEQKAKEALKELLKKYDVSRYVFTNKIQVEDGVIPHSHPVLTLDTDYIDEPNKMLTTFLHEQLHWWLNENEDAEHAAVEDFKKRYPALPTGRRELARSEYSTYMHLIVCYYELVLLREFVGEEAAGEVFDWLKGHHYKWIYRTVLKDEAEIAEIVKRHGLVLPAK